MLKLCSNTSFFTWCKNLPTIPSLLRALSAWSAGKISLFVYLESKMASRSPASPECRGQDVDSSLDSNTKRSSLWGVEISLIFILVIIISSKNQNLILFCRKSHYKNESTIHSFVYLLNFIHISIHISMPLNHALFESSSVHAYRAEEFHKSNVRWKVIPDQFTRSYAQTLDTTMIFHNRSSTPRSFQDNCSDIQFLKMGIWKGIRKILIANL